MVLKDDIKMILTIICNLDPSKAHSHDMISNHMLKMTGDAIIEPLFKIFRKCLKYGIFAQDWKKGNIAPTFKKGNKQHIKTYRPVSLLPICSKIFEPIIYDKYLLDNNQISPKQSEFRPGNFCINQLLSITHDVFIFFDNGFEVRGVFLDISKAFDKVWHDGIIYKLKQNRIKDKLLCLNRLFEKSPTKSSFKWSDLIMNKGECRPSTGINFGTFAVFDLHKQLAKRFTA